MMLTINLSLTLLNLERCVSTELQEHLLISCQLCLNLNVFLQRQNVSQRCGMSTLHPPPPPLILHRSKSTDREPTISLQRVWARWLWG